MGSQRLGLGSFVYDSLSTVMGKVLAVVAYRSAWRRFVGGCLGIAIQDLSAVLQTEWFGMFATVVLV